MIVDRLTAFWKKVDRRGPEECWLWRGARTEGGYGQLWSGVQRRGQPRTCLATHIALLIDGRPRPSPSHGAMHSCDNPQCVNPAHLAWGTAAENAADMIRKGRSPRGNGAPIGERHPEAKLTAGLVRYIRQSAATSLELAAELGVTNQCISRVRLRQTWRHVD